MSTLPPSKPKRKSVLAFPRREAVQLEALFSSIGEGIIATDEHGFITRVNQAALDMLGYRQRDILHKRFTEKIIAVHENGQPVNLLDRPIVKSFITGSATSERAYYRCKDGRILPVLITVSPIMLRRKPVGAIELFRDLTNEIENDKLKSDFISIASHQLRTPLSAINMYTRMLQDGMAGRLSKSQLEYTRVVLSSVDRMNELIDTLLNITRIEAGGLSIHNDLIRYDLLVRTIVEEFKPTAQAKHIDLAYDIPADLVEIHSDSLLVREVCVNIIGNAIKYTSEYGKVHITLEQRPSNLLLTVKDTGYGIPESARKHIFTKFFRAPNITTNDVSGTGLGLYLAKTISDALGGELSFESKVNKGTTFRFSLPLTLH